MHKATMSRKPGSSKDDNEGIIIYEEVRNEAAKIHQFHLSEDCSYVSTVKNKPAQGPPTFFIRPEATYETASKEMISSKRAKENFQQNFTICLLVSLIVMAVIMSGCCIAAFVEISRVKSKYNSINSIIVENLDNQKDYVDTLYSHLSQNVSAVEYATHNSILTLAHGIGAFSDYPASSCAAVLLLVPSSPSGHYWIRSSNGSAVRVYCDMTRSCGGVTGGWIRVAELDMTDNSSQCPNGLSQQNHTCVKATHHRGCSLSVNFSAAAVPYSKVCGKIRAYQYASTDAFLYNHSPQETIDEAYVDGVSLTHGSYPRQHIWTFAAAVDYDIACAQCTIGDYGNVSTPSFVGRDFFCDSGNQNPWKHVLYLDDPLWDGTGCNNMCCSFNSPPWFYKELSQSTTDDIEMRVCKDQARNDEDIAIEMVTLYVQ